MPGPGAGRGPGFHGICQGLVDPASLAEANQPEQHWSIIGGLTVSGGTDIHLDRFSLAAPMDLFGNQEYAEVCQIFCVPIYPTLGRCVSDVRASLMRLGVEASKE